jgi:hypothetical protein
VVVQNEHDDDIDPTVETRNEMETDDYPKTGDDFEAEEREDDRSDPDDSDDESIVGK